MAELTYDPTPADQPEFNEEEQEALKIGEQHEQELMYAGKFKDADQLERAYLELQKQFSSRETQQAEPEPESEPETEAKEEQQELPEPELDTQLTEQEATDLANMVGGEEAYLNMLRWAGDNLTQGEIAMFDSVVAQGNKNACYFAIDALHKRYIDAVGQEAPLISGRSPSEPENVFRSQAEVVAAMADPRYDKDPAYRNDIFTKLERSNLAY